MNRVGTVPGTPGPAEGLFPGSLQASRAAPWTPSLHSCRAPTHTMNFTSIGSVALVAFAGLLAPTQDTAAEAKSYTFQQAPVNARGITGLSDFIGQPVLVEFWGTM